VGGLLALKGSRTHGIQGQFISALGFGLLARAASNVPARSLVGLARTCPGSWHIFGKFAR
jgi:hypothetical protein